jgi:prefoldin subunit 5
MSDQDKIWCNDGRNTYERVIKNLKKEVKDLKKEVKSLTEDLAEKQLIRRQSNE